MTIYKVTNLIDGKIYIGQTTKPPKDRWRAHCYKNSTCRYLKHAIQYYGKNNFEFEVIACTTNIEDLNYLEKYFIELYQCLAPHGYNLLTGGKNYRASEVTKRKMSRTRKGKPLHKRRGIPPWNLGKKLGPQTPEHVKARIDAATEAKLKPIVCIETGEKFTSLKQAVEKMNLNQGNLTAVLHGRRKRVNGYSFAFLKVS